MNSILVDCKNLASYSGGISGYFKPLLRALIKHFKDECFVLVTHEKFDTNFLEELNNWEYKIVPYKKTGISQLDILVYDLLIFPRALKKESGKVFISPYYDFILPRKYRMKSLITVHDMCYWELKSQYPRKVRWYYMLLLKLNLSLATKVVTVSETSLESIKNTFGNKAANKTSVIYNTFATSDVPNVLSNSIKNPQTKRILYTGGFEGRKNVEMIFSGLSEVKKRVDVKLFFTGDFVDNDNLKALIDKYGLRDTVILTGLLSSKEVEEHYSSCDAVINLSLCEGFGRSNLEAVKYGKALICSDIKVFRELVDGYAIFCNPMDKISIVNAIFLSFNEKQNLKNFSFKKFELESNAVKLISILEDLINGR